MAKYSNKKELLQISDKNFEIRKYFYKYYDCADFLNIKNRGILNCGLFKDVNEDINLNQRLYDQISNNELTKEKRLARYIDLFDEDLARLGYEDGTFSFVFKSGKIIPDKFYANDNGGYKPEFFDNVTVKRIDKNNISKKEIKIDTNCYHFIDKDNVGLLDQTKIKSVKDIVLLINHSPEYLKQISPKFFTEKNIALIEHALDNYYYRKNALKEQFDADLDALDKEKDLYLNIIEKKKKLNLKLLANMPEQVEEKEEDFSARRRVEVIKEKKAKLSEDEKRAIFENLYLHIGYEQENFEFEFAKASPLERLEVKKRIIERKIELAENYRNNGVKKLKYIPNEDEDDFFKYEDNSKLWKETKIKNDYINKHLDLLEREVLQDFTEKLYQYEKKIDEYYTLNSSEVANEIINHKKMQGENWKEVTIYVPVITTDTTQRFGKTILTPTRCEEYRAVINSKFPKEFLSQSYNTYDEGKKKINRLKRQIANGNLIVLHRDNFNDVKLRSESPSREHCPLPLLSLESNSAYKEIHNIEKLLVKLVENNLPNYYKNKRKIVYETNLPEKANETEEFNF